MSLLEVRDAFKTLFDDNDIATITPKAYDFDILETSNFDTKKLYFESKINFFIYTVTRTVESKTFCAEQHNYIVEIKHYRDHDDKGVNQNTIRDVFEILHDRINIVLGGNWNNSVDYYRPQNKPITLNTIQLDGRTCWVGAFTYEAVRTVTV